jgi:methylmalonyl-CoA mutase
VEGFVGAVGGADAVSVVPFDQAVGPSDDFARGVARNAQVLLREESSLGQVVDPAGGSWYVETLTRQLAERAWVAFQALEGGGGMQQQLLDGAVGREVARVAEARRQSLVTRRDPVVGVSHYPQLSQEPLQRPRPSQEELLGALGAGAAHPELGSPGGWITAAIEAAGRGATVAQLGRALAGDEAATTAAPLLAWRDAEPFEVLRNAADLALARDGRRPTLLLVKLGAAREHQARADFAQGLIESGGIAVVDPGAFDSVEQAGAALSAADVDGAVICAADQRYPELVPALAPLLRQEGAKVVLLAGRPGDHESRFGDAGVDLFIHLGVDAVAALQALHQRLGVSR